MDINVFFWYFYEFLGISTMENIEILFEWDIFDPHHRTKCDCGDSHYRRIKVKDGTWQVATDSIKFVENISNNKAFLLFKIFLLYWKWKIVLVFVNGGDLKELICKNCVWMWWECVCVEFALFNSKWFCFAFNSYSVVLAFDPTRVDLFDRPKDRPDPTRPDPTWLDHSTSRLDIKRKKAWY